MNMRGQVVVKHYTGGTWVNSTNGILDISINRGISNYVGCWSQVEPGQLQLRSRDLSLSTLALQTRIRIEIDGVAIFTGKTYDVNTEYFPRRDSIVTITAFDELAALSLKKYRHATVIGHDYKDRELAEFNNFPWLLTGGGNDLHVDYAYQGTWRDGYGPYYSIANTDYGVSGFNPAAPAAGASSDSTWGTWLNGAGWDTDGLIICNSRAVNGGFGRGIYQGWYNNTNGIDYLYPPHLYNKMPTTTSPTTSTGTYYSTSGVTDTAHPRYQSYGFNKIYYKLAGSGLTTPSTLRSDYALLMTTNDTDMLSLFLKSEQSEAGFAYVDAKNRFRVYSRAIVDNDPHLSKATFSSTGNNISYNNIKVTNGWESVVQGVTVSNTWSNEFINAYNLDTFAQNWPPSGGLEFQLPVLQNRDGTTVTKTLNYTTNPSSNPPKDYDWLSYNTTENTYRWVKGAKTLNNVSPIWDVKTRSFELRALSTTDYFAGKTGLGTKQLLLNTNYAFNINTGAGYMWNQNGTTKQFDRANDTDIIDYNVIEKQAELADYILTNYGTAVKDVRSIDFSVHSSDLDTIKTIDIYDRITLNHNSDGFIVNKQYCVMGINHYITPDSWDVSYQLWNQQGRP